MTISQSASKIVFILMAATICACFGYEIVTAKVVLDSKDFLVLAGMAFTFYFSNKGEPAATYAGK